MAYRRLSIIFASLFCLLIFTGCLNPKKQVELGLQAASDEIAMMKSKQACCENLAELEFHPLSEQRLSVKLPKDDDRTRLFDGEPSYFVPLMLARGSATETILIRSGMFSDGPVSGIGRVFVPKIQFFNEQLEPVGAPVEPGMCFLRRWSEIGFFMAISVETTKATHAIVYSAAHLDRELLSYSDSVTVAAGFSPATVTSDLVRAVSADAKLDFWLDGENDRVLSELRGRCHLDLSELLVAGSAGSMMEPAAVFDTPRKSKVASGLGVSSAD